MKDKTIQIDLSKAKRYNTKYKEESEEMSWILIIKSLFRIC